MRAGFVVADRDTERGYEGSNLEAEVALGQRLRWLRLGGGSDEDHAVALSLNFGIFSRFHMAASERDLINVGYKVLVPLEWRSGPWHGRVGYEHLSAHHGDEYVARYLLFVEQTSRDGFEVMFARDFGRTARIYGGGDVNVHTNDRMAQIIAQWGLELDPRPAEGEGGAWPFLATHFQYSDLRERVSSTIVAGVGFVLGGRRVRLEGRGHFGPTPMAQFREADEWFVGGGLRIEI